MRCRTAATPWSRTTRSASRPDVRWRRSRATASGCGILRRAKPPATPNPSRRKGALAADGTTNFADLQDRIATGTTDDLVFFAFDLLYLDGFDFTGLALEQRKEALAEIVPHDGSDMVRYSDHQVGRGPDFFRQACN